MPKWLFPCPVWRQKSHFLRPSFQCYQSFKTFTLGSICCPYVRYKNKCAFPILYKNGFYSKPPLSCGCKYIIKKSNINRGRRLFLKHRIKPAFHKSPGILHSNMSGRQHSRSCLLPSLSSGIYGLMIADGINPLHRAEARVWWKLCSLWPAPVDTDICIPAARQARGFPVLLTL